MKAQLNLPAITDLSSIIDGISRSLDGLIPSSRLDTLSGKQVLFTNDGALKPVGGWDTAPYGALTVERLERIDIPAYVVAVDSSCILVGESSDGSIYSAKCSIALSCNGRPATHALLGPLLFYIQDGSSDGVEGMGMDDVKRMIRVRLERLIQHELARSLSGVILLVDGSLRHSAYEHIHTMDRIEDECSANGNMLVGLSKSTRLRYLEHVASLLSREVYPCYADVTSMVWQMGCDGRRMRKERCMDDAGICADATALDRGDGGDDGGDGDDGCMGGDGSASRASASSRGINRRVYMLLAKLASNGLVFRADVLDDPHRSLGMLIANDALHNGYPESLRIAHHTSVFTHTDVLCIKGLMKSRFGVREVDGDDVRRVLLGRI
ncbi:MAG: DNA double-strand break repair nuclease NurA [Candidatus Nitrosocaldus sp.]|nr:DNA double-strand break repair nuclease NurA [Candidatus Nitrosocaldus sp.]MCS7141664.1 DNA double-strand break repair nuclease NurA [Candidatus Nitrosocaldus sp.]MDW8000683.1 DNA double-strand break repair nuclease NurA [Candidatus Nitrosocaldus sp.]MDW8276256.1 DNA double-strand break repair nuclease NurA [Candidatus Nitrosocaldus sp.]